MQTQLETIPNMIFGAATVELVMRAEVAANLERHDLATVVEPLEDVPGLVWARVHVFSFTFSRYEGGYNYDIRGYAGGWCPKQNARNFVKVEG